MKVKELIALLNTVDGELPVKITGWENDYSSYADGSDHVHWLEDMKVVKCVENAKQYPTNCIVLCGNDYDGASLAKNYPEHKFGEELKEGEI
jgi:hypothetical protein